MEERIQTPRLVIRRVTLADGPGLADVWRNFAASPYAWYDRPHPTDPEEARQRAERWAARSQDPAHRFYAVLCGERLAGYVSLHQREAGKYEIGYCFHSDFHGKGIAREALGALLPWMRQQGARVITAGTAVDNLPSVRLLAALGFRETGRERVSFYQDENGNDVYFEGGLYALSLAETE